MSVTADNMEEILDAPVIAAAPPKLTLWQRLNLSMEHIVLALFTVAVVVGPRARAHRGCPRWATPCCG